MAEKTKIYDPACSEWAKKAGQCKTVDQLIKEGTPPNITPAYSGLYHTVGPAQPVHFKTARNSWQKQKGGAYIVLGNDRPDSVRSGYGAKGAQKAATIDLVVGRMASAKPKVGSYVDNSFFADAARIYISQLTNVDTNFGLASGGSSFSQNACSAVAVKADAIRIIGREGIKIVTGTGRGVKGFGTSGETNSRGGAIEQPAPPIELIAGNSIEPRQIPGGKMLLPGEVNRLQPVPLGNNTADALEELHGLLGEVWSALFNFALVQSGQNVAFGVSPFPWHAAAVSAATPGQLSFVINSLYHTRAKATVWQLNYLSPAGYKYICSKNVKTT